MRALLRHSQNICRQSGGRKIRRGTDPFQSSTHDRIRAAGDVLQIASAAYHASVVTRPYFDFRMAAVSASSMTGVTTNRIIDSHWSVNM